MKILDTIVLIVVLLMVIGALVIFYMLFAPVKVIDFPNTPIPINKKEVVAGDHVQLNVDYCKYKDLPATINRALVDTVIIFYEATQMNAKMGCNTLPLSIKIPDYAPSGTYFFRTFMEYQVNPIRKVTVMHETEKFHVIGLVDKLPEVISP